jgi:hypothetical protein
MWASVVPRCEVAVGSGHVDRMGCFVSMNNQHAAESGTAVSVVASTASVLKFSYVMYN